MAARSGCAVCCSLYAATIFLDLLHVSDKALLHMRDATAAVLYCSCALLQLCSTAAVLYGLVVFILRSLQMMHQDLSNEHQCFVIAACHFTRLLSLSFTFILAEQHCPSYSSS